MVLRRTLARVAAGVAAVALVGLAASPAAAAVGAADATGDGAVSVRVTLSGRPVETTVTLTGSRSDGQEITKKSATDTRGRVTFSRLPSSQEWSWTATAQNDGVTFSTDRFALAGGDDVVELLATFPTTTSAKDVVQDAWTVWVDLHGETMAVQQDVALTNSGTAAYIGSTPVQGTGDKNRAAVELPLSAGATDLQYLGRFEVCCSVASVTSWASTRPVDPGTSTGTLRYEAPATTTLSFPVRLATTAFTVLVPAGATVTSPRLVRDGSSTDNNVTYDVYRSTGPLAAGDTLDVVVEAPGAGGAGVWPWVAVAAALLVVIGGLGWWLLRRRREPEPPRPSPAVKPKGKSKVVVPPTAGHKPASASSTARTAPRAGPAPAPAAAPAPAPASTPTSPTPITEVQVLADELAMLDLAWEHGSLKDEASYRRVRESIMARMMAAMKPGDSVPSP